MQTALNYDNAIYWATRQHDLLKQQAALEARITALEYEIERHESDALGAVTSEKEDGKPRFTNELARKAEVAHRLALDPDYQRARAELTILNRESQHMQREAKYAGKIVEIMCTFARKEQEPLIPVPAIVLSMIGHREETVRIPPIDEDLTSEDFEESSAA